MKRFAAAVGLLAQLFVAGTVLAMPVNVDFTVLGGSTVDITSPNSLTLNGMTMQYDNFGSTADTARATAAGLGGSTFGSLMFDLGGVQATSLNFGFSLVGAQAPVTNAVGVTLFSNGASLADVSANTDAAGAGQFSYTGGAFDKAIMFFGLDTPEFAVASVSYDTASVPVPEPSAFALFAAGLAGFGFLRRRSAC